MRKRITPRSVGVIAVAAAALLLAMFVTANADVSESTIYACVKKSGVPRIVSNGAVCKSSETGLSWNSAGPPGPPGEKGERGEAGPGTVAYAADDREQTALSGETTLLTKTLPPGSYVVAAKAWIVAGAKTQVRTGALCFLWNSPIGHPGQGTAIDIGSWAGVSGEYEPERTEGAATISLQGAVTTTPTTGELTVTCRSTSNSAASARAEGASLNAIQASEIH